MLNLIGYNYYIIDAAGEYQEQDLFFDNSERQECLFTDSPGEVLKSFAPYLFSYSNSPIIKENIIRSWGTSLGILIKSDSTFNIMTQHLRRFLVVKTEDDEQLYFRFYDPRVLRIFLPTCDEKQLKEFFGPIEQFICEDEDPNFALVFSFEKNALKTQRITKESLFETTEQKNQGRKFFV